MDVVNSAALVGDIGPDHPLARLARRPFWVAWRGERKADGRFSKIPQRRSGIPGDLRLPQNRWPLANALNVMASWSPDRQPRGVGVVAGLDFSGWKLVAFDLDAALLPDGRTAPWADELLAELPCTYVETSPSGGGLRVLLRVSADDHSRLLKRLGCGRRAWPQDEWRNAPDRKSPAIEVFASDCFVTITGNTLPEHCRLMAVASFETLEPMVARLDRAMKQPGTDATTGIARGKRDKQRKAAKTKPARVPLGGQDKIGYLRVPLDEFGWAAQHLSDTGLQVFIAQMSAARVQHQDSCQSAYPHDWLLRLPGRTKGSTRSETAVQAAKRELEKAGRMRLVQKAKHTRRGDRENRLAIYELPHLHLANATRTPRPKVAVARSLVKRMTTMPAPDLRVVLVVLAAGGKLGLTRVELSGRSLCEGIMVQTSQRRMLAALKAAIASEWLEVVRRPAGQAPGLYRLGPRVFIGPSGRYSSSLS